MVIEMAYQLGRLPLQFFFSKVVPKKKGYNFIEEQKEHSTEMKVRVPFFWIIKCQPGLKNLLFPENHFCTVLSMLRNRCCVYS
jgi:hypothetical protein